MSATSTGSAVSESKPSAAPPADEPQWLRCVAVLTGVLAALGGFLTVRSTNLSNEALYHSTQAVMRQSRASDAWAQYQADSVKARVIETQLALKTGDAAERNAMLSADTELRERQPALQSAARQLERERDALLVSGQHRLAEKDLLGYAGMLTQLAIALASVAAMVRRPAAFITAIVAGAAALAITAFAVISHYSIT